MAFVDWLQWTIKQSFKDGEESQLIDCLFSSLPYKLQDLLGFHCSDFTRQSYSITKGINFYQGTLCFDCGLKVLYNPPRENMGTNFIISGELLSKLNLDDIEIGEWYRDLQKWDYTLSRVDLAIDCDTDFSWFYRKYLKGEFLTSYRRSNMSRNLDGNCRGTLYFGKRGKGTFFRIYDKYQEQLDKLSTRLLRKEFVEKHGDRPWTRIEGEFRHGQAENALKEYLIGKTGEIFLGHLKFVKEMKSNKSRCEVDEVYTEIVKAQFGRKVSKVQNKSLNTDWLFTIFGYVNALRKFNPDLYNLLCSGVQASPSAYGKMEDSSVELERLEHTVKDYIRNQQKERWKLHHIIESSSFDKVYIDGEIELEECV